MKKSIFYCFIVLAFTSCKDNESELSYVPNLEFISISPLEITEFKEKVSLVIKYEDNDGDLGENNPDVKNLFITDQRNGVQYTYRIPQLSPNGSNIRITGNLEINLNSLSVVGSGTSESVIFNIYAIDRAGNQSNTITSSSIIVSK